MTVGPLDRIRAVLANRYEIERELGSGGMATVYLARDVRHDRRVAVKVLRGDVTATLGPARFLSEVRVTARLQHPHILPLLDSGEGDGMLYYVMPFVEGESLAARLAREGQLPVTDAVRILHDVADALAYAHAHGVVHRDIKPDNILISGRHAVVADFGIAKAVSDATGQHGATTTGMALGTPRYMSPEQATADPRVDHRADLYALGVVAYEMLSGSTPFTGVTAQAVLAAHTTQAPEPLSARRPAIPPALGTLVMRCLEKNPADRWQRADEVVSELEVLTTPGEGIAPARTTPPPRARRRTLRIAAVAAAAAVVIVILVRQGTPIAPDPRRVIAVPFDVSGADALGDAGVRAANQIEQGLSEAGAVAAGVSTTEERDPKTLRRLSLAAGAGTIVTGTLNGRGDSVQAHAQIHVLQPGVGLQRLFGGGGIRRLFDLEHTGADAEAAVDGIRDRVLGAVAIALDAESRDWDVTQYETPSNLELFRLHRQGARLFNEGRFADAISVFEEVFAKDSSYLFGIRTRAFAHMNLGSLEHRIRADSLTRYLEARRSRLKDADVHWVGLLRAGLSEGAEQAYRAASSGARIDPKGFAYAALSASVSTFRPREALRHFARHDTTTVFGRNWVPWWVQAINAYHLLGEDETALQLARAGRERNPQAGQLLIWEARLLAALGRFEELERVLNQSVSVMRSAPTAAYGRAGLELAAHGFPERAQQMFNRVLEWIDTRAELEPGSRDFQYAKGANLYYLERWAESAGVFEALLEEFPGNDLYRVWLGMAMARQGRTEEARELARGLRAERPQYYRGVPLYYAARIYAALGERDEAVTLLRQSMDLGTTGTTDWHADPELRRLRGFPAFEALIRPKG